MQDLNYFINLLLNSLKTQKDSLCLSIGAGNARDWADYRETVGKILQIVNTEKIIKELIEKMNEDIER